MYPQEGAHPDAGTQAVICAHFLLLISHNSIYRYIYIVIINIEQLGKLRLLYFWKRALLDIDYI